jgi:hypothetical protein
VIAAAVLSQYGMAEPGEAWRGVTEACRQGGRPGAQTERRGGTGPAGGLLRGKPSPAAFFRRAINRRHRGEEMVPSKEPVVVPSIVSYKRSLVKLPVAPANRPVPPVMVAVSSI